VTRVGDLASEVGEQLQQQHIAEELAGEQLPDADDVMRAENRKSLFAKIEFKWRSSDHKSLEQLRAAVDRAFKELYDWAIEVVDELYGQMRVPDTDDGGHNILDSRGRVQWKRDSRGREIEDWSQLDGQDIEKCILDITRIKLALAPQLNDLLLEAVFAKHIADDVHNDAFTELLEETIPGRNAHAARKSRQDRYHAFFRYYLYSHAESFMKELNNFSRVLERIRYWRIEGGT
jgi:hypothetical protein